MATTPGTHPDIYKSILLGNLFSPGTVKLSGFDRSHDWEEQKPKGATGTVTVSHGSKNSGFTAEFYLADLEDIEAWDQFQRLIASTTDGPTPRALPAYHPDLVRNRITDVVCASIGGFAHDGKNGATVVVKFLEYRPAKAKAAVKPKGSGAAKDASAGTRPDPNAEAKRELAALRGQVRTT